MYPELKLHATFEAAGFTLRGAAVDSGTAAR
jgi:hypothetical protein